MCGVCECVFEYVYISVCVVFVSVCMVCVSVCVLEKKSATPFFVTFSVRQSKI